MKYFIIPLTILAMSFYGCKNTPKNEHSHETTEEHASHSHTGETTEHEGHDHEAEESHNHETENDNHKTREAAGHSDEIIFTKAQAAKTDFEVKEIQPGTFHQIIKTTGQILPAPGDESIVIATGNGVISYANNQLTEGSAVRQGQSIFYIESKNMEEGDHYSKMNANYEKTKAEFERAEKLIKDKIISQKEYENIRLDYRNAKIAYDAVSGKQSAKGVRVSSPLNGFLKNIYIKDGEYVTAGQAIATVSQNKKLLLRADVSEKYYNILNTIQNANFQTPYDNQVYALPDLSGKLLSVGKAAGANTFYIPVTFEFDNRGAIVPGSFVEVYLISSPLENRLSIPVSALTNEMGYFYIYLQLDEEGYKKQEVKIGANNGKDVEILSGLKAGDRVVTQGAYQVKMASASGAIPHGHSHEH
ncbi:MAG: efflux RND transporter periplasmic adaptor subunit [Odoribacter sp.]